MKNLLLDVRNHDEISNMKLKETKEISEILYIPSNTVKFNLEFLNSYFKQFDQVYIICRSGNRSSQIKDKYFKDTDNVQIYKYNYNNIPKEQLESPPENTSYSLVRKIQMIMGTILLVIFILSFHIKNMSYVLLPLSLFMIYVGVSGNCFMSSILTKNDI